LRKGTLIDLGFPGCPHERPIVACRRRSPSVYGSRRELAEEARLPYPCTRTCAISSTSSTGSVSQPGIARRGDRHGARHPRRAVQHPADATFEVGRRQQRHLGITLETIEQRIADAEKELQTRHESLLDPAVMSDGPKLREVSLEMEAAQKSIEELYARWAELDEKKNVPT